MRKVLSGTAFPSRSLGFASAASTLRAYGSLSRSTSVLGSKAPMTPSWLGGKQQEQVPAQSQQQLKHQVQIKQAFSAAAHTTAAERAYHWISPEEEQLISKAYNRHKAIAQNSQAAWPPSLAVEDLEKLGKEVHYEPRNMRDKFAAFLVNGIMFRAMHLFFREKYDHHACVLETVAAVPGTVASFHRHFRSLRNMKRDHGWINPLQEEAENERMHLLIWMKVTKPTAIERVFVLGAQFSYLAIYTTLYWVSPYTAHRMVGYLEECAVKAYNDYLAAVDSGAIKNGPAPNIAKKYYRLPDEATLRDVILHVRGDECMHRDFNHMLGDKHGKKDIDSEPVHMTGDLRWVENISNDRLAGNIH